MIENTQKEQLKEYWLKEESKDQRPIDRKEAIGQLQLEGWLQYAAIAKQLFASLAKFQEGADFTEYQNLKQKIKAGELAVINNEPLLRILAELEKEEEKITKLLATAQEKVNKGVEEDGKESQKDLVHQLYFMETGDFWSVTRKMELTKNPLVIIITLLKDSGIDSVFDNIYGQKSGAIGFFGKKDFGIEGSQVSLIVNKLGNIRTLRHELNHALFELLANALKPKAEILGIKKNAWPEPVEFPQRVKENFLEDVRQYSDELKKPNSPLMTWCLDMAKNELLAKFTGNGVFSDSYMRKETPILGNAESYDYATQWIYYQASLSINGNFGNRSVMMYRLVPEYMGIIKPIIEKADELIKLSSDIPGYIEMLPWVLIQIPISQWLEKINDILIPDVQYRKKYLDSHPSAVKLMSPTVSGFRYYRAGFID
jgi:hypothetical protein